MNKNLHSQTVTVLAQLPEISKRKKPKKHSIILLKCIKRFAIFWYMLVNDVYIVAKNVQGMESTCCDWCTDILCIASFSV